MEISDSTRNLLITGFGLAYLFGGIANFLYIRKNGFESFTSRGWLAFSRRWVQTVVIPNSKFFMILLFVLQELFAITILIGDPFVVYGLLGGAIFSLWAVFVDSPSMSITYFILAVAQFFLVYTR
jgi:hypothetical protein